MATTTKNPTSKRARGRLRGYSLLSFLKRKIFGRKVRFLIIRKTGSTEIVEHESRHTIRRKGAHNCYYCVRLLPTIDGDFTVRLKNGDCTYEELFVKSKVLRWEEIAGLMHFSQMSSFFAVEIESEEVFHIGERTVNFTEKVIKS